MAGYRVVTSGLVRGGLRRDYTYLYLKGGCLGSRTEGDTVILCTYLAPRTGGLNRRPRGKSWRLN